MNLTDALTELWRLAESGDTQKETRLESTASDFQDELFVKNKFLAGDARDRFIGPLEERELPNLEGEFSPEQSSEWAPFTNEELDAIRHYYGQKIALENENPIVGIGVPLAHEIFDLETGLTSPHWKESLYDMYVNAIATKDHYLDKGLPGTPFHQMLTRDNITEREFNFWGEDALKRVPVYEE